MTTAPELLFQERNRAIGFIKPLHGEPQLRVRITRPAGDALIAAFDLTGLEEAIAPLQNACAWD